MTDMSTSKQLTGDIVPPSSQDTKVPLGTSTNPIADSINNNL
jgi:hypothetical protein